MTAGMTSVFAPDPREQKLRIETLRKELPLSAAAVLSDDALRQVEQVVDGVFGGDRLRQNRVVIIAGVDKQKESSLWLSAGVASALTARTGEAVHVLSIQVDGSEGAVVQIDPMGTIAKDCHVERISESMLRRDAGGRSQMSARAAELRAAGHVVLIHVPNLQQQTELLNGLDRIDGVVLLIRAALTRKAALKSIQELLGKARVSVLGAVLLDRVYPIPEKLYRML